MNHADTASLLASLQELLRERFDIPAETATLGAALTDLGLDSMIVLDVIMEVEDRLGVTLADLEMPRNPTLGDVVKLIQRNLTAGG